MDETTLFKVLNEKGRAYHGGNGAWSLPNGKAGKWMPTITNLMPCARGYHLCRGPQVLAWLGSRLFIAEARGTVVEAVDKIVVASARLVSECEHWDERTARLFAADCAEAVLHIYEQHQPSDSRPRDAIEVVRRYARGEATHFELTAARDAAAAAAAARAAAREAEFKRAQSLMFSRLCEYLRGEVD
jgi:hypothetical protein